MTPSIGRIVHYYERPWDARPGELRKPIGPHAAIVTRVWSDTCVSLQVMFDAGPARPVASVLFDEAEGPSTNSSWRWPPRV
jgi:hypothetical protein